MDNPKNNSAKNRAQLMRVLLVILTLIGWGCLVFSYIQSYSYAFPMVSSVDKFLSLTIPNICVPLLVIVVCFFLAVKKHDLIFTACYILSILLLAGCFLRGSSEMLYNPTVCSYTTDPSNFGTFDSKLEPNIDAIELFPDTIPPTAKDVEYTYYFEETSADTVYISLSVSYGDDADIQGLLLQLEEAGATVNPFGEMVYRYEDGTNPRPYLYSCVILDSNSRRAAFVVASSPEDLPECLDELIYFADWDMLKYCDRDLSPSFYRDEKDRKHVEAQRAAIRDGKRDEFLEMLQKRKKRFVNQLEKKVGIHVLPDEKQFPRK